MDREEKMNTSEPVPGNRERGADHAGAADEQDRAHETPNPPHTTTGKITSPKFGSAGSGGAELEPGPKRN
jgi:hypothetical protein